MECVLRATSVSIIRHNYRAEGGGLGRLTGAVLLADFESTVVGNAGRQKSQQVDIKGTTQQNNKTTKQR
jgi:membrane protein involved in colicin uptake